MARSSATRATWLAIAAITATCTSCSSCKTEITAIPIGEKRGDADVEVVRVDETGPDLGVLAGSPPSRGGTFTMTRHELRVAGEPPVVHALQCQPGRVDVTLEPGGARIGYRCDPTGPWWIVDPVPRDRREPHVPEPHAHVAWAPTPAASVPQDADGWLRWSSVPPLDVVAPSMLLQHDASGVLPVATPGRVLDEVRHRRGDARLAEVLVATVGMVATGDGRSTPEAWIDAFHRLPPPHRDAPRAALRAALARRDAGSGVVIRALRLLDPVDASWLDDLAARADELEAAPPGVATVRHGDVAGEVLALLAARRPTAAADLACARIGRGEVDATRSLVAIIAARRPCPAVAERARRARTDPESCKHTARSCAGAPGSEPCGPTRVEGIARDPSTRAQPPGSSEAVLLLAALRGAGASDPELERLAARAAYAIHGPCPDLANYHDRAVALCAAGSSDRGATARCMFRIDDRERAFVEVAPR